MIIYMILFSIIIGLGIHLDNKNNIRYLKVVCFIIWILMCLRDESVGVDIRNYFNLYEFDVQYSSVMNHIVDLFNVKMLLNENLWYITLAIFRKLYISPRLFLCIVSGWLVYSFYWFAKRYAKNYLIAIITFLTIGVFPMYMSGLRQAIAMGVVTFSYKYIQEKKIIPFIFLIIVATGFHASAMAFLPCYFVVSFLEKLNIKRPVVTIMGTGIVGVILSGSILNILSLVGLSQRYQEYLTMNLGTNIVLIILYYAVAVICIFMQYVAGESLNYSKNDDMKCLSIFFLVYGIALAIWILSVKNAIISRIAYYYMLPLPIILSNSMSLFKLDFNEKIVTICIIVIELLFFIATARGQGYGNYKFFFV